MADIALALDDFGHGDIALDGRDLERDNGLETAVILSLFCDRRATPEQVPPGVPADDLRGYWGDVRPDVEGDQLGSLLWLLEREKQTTGTLARAQQYVGEALQWMVEDRVASRVEVRTSYPMTGIIRIEVDIYRPGGNLARYRYDYEWAAQAAKRAA
jgi:phage gp46-like protein